MNKLDPKINFKFEEQDNLPDFIIDVDFKTNVKSDTIKIIKHKKRKRDVSTGLF